MKDIIATVYFDTRHGQISFFFYLSDQDGELQNS